MKYGARICSFGGALGDLPVKFHDDTGAVLNVLREHPEFSVFDVSTDKLARTMDALKAWGRIRYVKDRGYPWARVEIVPEGGPK